MRVVVYEYSCLLGWMYEREGNLVAETKTSFRLEYPYEKPICFAWYNKGMHRYEEVKVVK